MDISPSFITINPSLQLPGIIMQYAQASGAFELLAGGDPLVRLGEGDLMVYINMLDVRTEVAAGQSAYNQLPSCTVMPKQISTPTYLIRTRAEYDHHDTAAAARRGYSIVESQRLAMRQGTFQQLRNALLYGFNPANGEGLLNTTGATTISLPADSYGNTTVATYDNGQMATFLLAQVMQTKARCMQLGLPVRVVILGPQRTLGAFGYQNVVQLTQYQRPGGGSTSTVGMLRGILEDNKDVLEWVYDDTLIGKGANGTDAVIMAVPEVGIQRRANVNTNAFAMLDPGIDSTTLQLVDMAAPREIPTPMVGGAIDVVSELRTTSGWAIRPEAITIISMPNS